MRTFLLVLWVCSANLVVKVEAQEENPSIAAAPTLIEGSSSPDGRKEMTVTDTSSNGAASGVVRVRDTKTGATLGSFEWSGFGEHTTANLFYSILWRGDSRAFAVESNITRGYLECQVFFLSEGRRCTRIKLPAYGRQITKKYDLVGDGKGRERPVKWLVRSRLVLNVYNRGWHGEGRYSNYQVILRIPTKAHVSDGGARVESIRPYP